MNIQNTGLNLYIYIYIIYDIFDMLTWFCQFQTLQKPLSHWGYLGTHGRDGRTSARGHWDCGSWLRAGPGRGFTRTPNISKPFGGWCATSYQNQGTLKGFRINATALRKWKRIQKKWQRWRPRQNRWLPTLRNWCLTGMRWWKMRRYRNDRNDMNDMMIEIIQLVILCYSDSWVAWNVLECGQGVYYCHYCWNPPSSCG